MTHPRSKHDHAPEKRCCLCGQPIATSPSDPVALRVPLEAGSNSDEPLYCHSACLTETQAERADYVIPTFHDLSRGQAAQALLAAIVESSDDAIISKTLEGVITSWNRGAQLLFGYTPEEAIGRSITLIIPPDLQSEEAVILSRLRRGERIEHFETVRRAKDGRLIPISLSISRVRDATGRIIGASKVARDITDQKESQRRLEEADRRKDEFLALLAHELRNPLGPIRHAVKILRAKTPSTSELQWATNIIDRQAEHMTRLVEDLLDVSRITRGTIELRRERIDIGSVVKAAVESIAALRDKARHQIEIQLPGEPLYVDGDPTRLTQVVTNLLDNAVKFTDPGGQITVTASREGDSAVIEVSDTGIGIPPELLTRIFDMFTQADVPVERSQGGLGVGLALVERLVKLHGGSVSAHSEGPGKGTEFTIRLPLAVRARAQRQRELASSRDAAAANRCKVLVVDDNEDSADSLGTLLRMLGHEVHTAYDGDDALASASAFQPEIAILDIGLPKMSGYELATRLREEPWASQLVLVALTGWGQEEHRRRSAEVGFHHHLTKPVELHVLQQILDDVEACRPAR